MNKQFPLEEIRDSKASQLAIQTLATLVGREDELTIHEFAYLTALEQLIHEYANTNEESVSDVSAHEFLAHLLAENSLSTTELSGETGIPETTIKRFLAGDCELVGSQIKKLGQYFNLNPAAFLL
ncbi:MAG: helix-turn-helix transcriptional regulator [Candidatus Obscuribacterales bacterium]|nr:helix-turn-helix transcriptional regulator [Candidatus Obscuribacterales bacterium]